MAKPSIPPEEMQRFELQKSLGEQTAKFVRDNEELADARQFETDFTALAFAIIALSQPTPTPTNTRTNDGLTPLKRATLPRRLPLGPLRRMAMRVGPKVLRHIMAVGSDQSQEFFRLELRKRLDREFPKGNLYKRLDHDIDIIRFGHEVLTIERDCNIARGKALERAAESLRMTAASMRTLEREFRRFKRLCRLMGHVPHPLAHLGHRPCFALRDLDGRTTDKSE